MILAGVPTGWNEGENSRMKRLLEQQDFDTNLRQAPLRDDLLRAQAQHLRMAGSQRLQERAQENAANMAYWNALNAPGGQAPSLNPPPIGGGAPPMPQPQTVQPSSAIGAPGQIPFMMATLPPQAPPMSGMAPPAAVPQGMGQQPGPIQGAVPMPQAVPDNPFQQAIQQRQQALQQLRLVPPTPASVRAGIQLDQELRQLQQTEVLQRIKLDEELRRQQNTSSLIQSRQAAGERGERRLDETERSHQAAEGLRERSIQATSDRASERDRLRAAELEIKNLTTNFNIKLKPDQEEAIFRKYGVSAQDLKGKAQDQAQVRTNPFADDKEGFLKFKQAVNTKIHSMTGGSINEPGDIKPFTMDVNGKKYRVYKGDDGKAHFDPE